MPVEIDTTIEELAEGGIATSTVDGRTATAMTIDNLIKADSYLAGKAAVSGTNAHGGPKSAWGAVRMAKVVPPGA